MASQTISKICSVNGCMRREIARQMCANHYYHYRKTVVTDCSIDECSKPAMVGKLCSMHAKRMRLYGNVSIVFQNTGVGNTPEERFWSRVNKQGPPHPTDQSQGCCWEWNASLSKGYGLVVVNRRKVKSHRAAWMYVHGEMPSSDIFLLHSCDNRKCVNPKHLREGTPQDNIQDMYSRDRASRGSAHPGALINETQARQIKILLRDKVRQCDIVRQLNVQLNVVVGIRRNRTWKHIKI